MRIRRLLVPVLALALAACGKTESPAPGAPPAAGPVPVATLSAPAGTYKLDPYHRTVEMRLMHLGLAPYVTRFTRLDATITLDPKDLSKSTLTVNIDPTSIRTDFSGDYPGTHKDSPYASFDEALARDPKFLNADVHKEIVFRSTKVEDLRGNKLRVTGDLTFLGQTHPVTLEAELTGSMEKHPYSQRGMVGFTAMTRFNRSQWGMTGTQQYLGDEVTLEFFGEFGQAEAADPAK